jgi:ADP-ribose pyrophosphatase YjhB (NUDIX family)
LSPLVLDLAPIAFSFADFAIDLSAWQPQLHPRDSHGRFRDKWGLQPAAKKLIDKILAHFSPASFKSDDHAQSYAETLAAKAKRTPKQKDSLDYVTTVNGWDDVESTLRAGSTDSPHIHAMDQMMAPLQNDVLVTHVMGPDSFGLPPERIGEIEEWTGQLISDKGFMSTNLGNPMAVDTPHVTMYMVVPKGTRAVVPGGSREIILDREQPIRIMKVEPDGHGGVNVTAVVQPKQGGGVHRNLGKALQPHEHAPAIDATPDEHAKRGLNPDGTPMVNPNATTPTPVPVQQAAPALAPAAAPAAPAPPIEPIKASPGSIAAKRTIPEKTAKAPAVPAEKKAVAEKAVAKKAEPAVAKAAPAKKVAPAKKAVPEKTAKAPAVPAKKATPETKGETFIGNVPSTHGNARPVPEKKAAKPSEPIKAVRAAKVAPSEAIKSKKAVAKAQHAETAKAEPVAQAIAEVDELNAKNASSMLMADHIDAIASGPHVENISDPADRADVVHRLKDIARDFREGNIAQGRTKLAKLGKEHGLTQQHSAGQHVKFEEGKHNDVGGTLKPGETATVIRPGHMQTRKDGSTVQLDRPVVKKLHAAKHASPEEKAPSPAPAKKAATAAKKAVPAKKASKAATPEVHAPGTELHKSPVHVQVGDTLHEYHGYQGGVVARIEKKNGRYHFYDKNDKELLTELGVAHNGKLKFRKGESPNPGTELGPVDAPSEHVHEPKLLKKATGHFGTAADPGENGDGYSSSGKWGKFGAAGALIRAPGEDGQARYLMVQRGPSVSHNKGLWQLPGGALNGNENPYQGASREIIEEVRAHPDYVKGLKPVGEHVYEDGSGWKYTTIAADAPHTFNPHADGGETGDAKWFTAEEIKQMVADGHVTPSVKKSLLGLIDDHEATHASKTMVPTTPEAAKLASEVEGVDLNKKYVKELKAMAADKGIKVPSTAKKADIIKLLQGEHAPAPTPKSILTKEPTVADLKADAKSKGIKVPSSAKKADVQKLLDDHAAGKLGPEHMVGPAKPKYDLKKAPAEVKKLQDWREKVKNDPYMSADAKAVALSEGYRTWLPAYKAELAKRAWEQHGKTLDAIGWDEHKIKSLFDNQGGKSFDEQWTSRLSSQVEKATDDGLEKMTVSELHDLMHKEKIYAPYGSPIKAKIIAHIREARLNKAKMAKTEAEIKAKIAENLKAEAAKHGIPVEMVTQDWSTLRQVGPQGGSNPGGVFEAPDGSRWYVKVQKSQEHAANEALSSSLYQELGIDAPKVYYGHDAPGLSGKHMTATRIVPHAKQDLKQHIHEGDQKYLDKIYEGFAADAWLANWDVAGLTYDNIVSSEGQPVRIDAGGSLLFRAQGDPKGDAFGPVVSEWDTFRDPTSKRSSAVLYRGITEEQMREAGERLDKLTPKRIYEMVNKAGLPKSVGDTLVERRADILSRIREKPVFEHKAVHGVKALKHAPTYADIVDHLEVHGVPKEKAKEAKYAIHSYTGSGYTPINKILLKGQENDPKAEAHYRQEIHAIDEAMRHSTVAEDVIVYRGERNPSRSFPEGVWSLDGGMEGMEWTFKPFSSTSTAVSVAQSFAQGGTQDSKGAQPTVMRIRVPKRTHGISIANGHEEELILDRGLHYRVVADHGVQEGIRYLDVEVVPA